MSLRPVAVLEYHLDEPRLLKTRPPSWAALRSRSFSSQDTPDTVTLIGLNLDQVFIRLMNIRGMTAALATFPQLRAVLLLNNPLLVGYPPK